MNAEVLRVETVQYRALHDQLQQRFDGLDDETLKNTLEGLSDLPEILAELVRSAIDDEAMIAALKMRCEAMAARLSRLKERHQKKRVLAPQGIKCLSLIFIDKVDNYVRDEGLIKVLFREEYAAVYREFHGADPTPEQIAAGQKRAAGFVARKPPTAGK